MPRLSFSNPDVPEWTRPKDWLPLPEVNASMQKFAGLLAVFNDGTNYVALSATAAYTIDWGDGSANEDIATGVTAQHQYTYASINSNTLSSRGYKQVIVTIVPQAGEKLNSVSLAKKHSSVWGQIALVGWLDVSCSCHTESTDGFVAGTNIVNTGYLEKCTIYNGSARANIGSILRDCVALKSVVLGNQNYNNVTNTFTAFYNTGLETQVDINTPAVTSAISMYQLAKVKKLTLSNVPLLQNLTSFANTCSLLEELTIVAPSATIITTLANGCPKLKKVNLAFGSLVTTTTNMFAGSINITDLVITGITVSFSVLNLNLSDTALNTLFTGLPTVTGNPSVTITGCPGAATCDTSILIAKGWSAIN
jgi:hypothetical protein